MLLKPNYEAEFKCSDLLLNVGNADKTLICYTCSPDCPHELLSWYANALCSCGSKMAHKVKVVRKGPEKESNEGAFLKKTATRFMITDNFNVMPSSTQAVLNLLHCAGTSMSDVVQKQVKVGLSEIIAILHRSLISEDTFTRVFLATENNSSLEKNASALIPCSKVGSDCSDSTVGIKLIVEKHENKFVYAECKQDFVDILFSFLTYPSGFVIKSLNGNSHLACLDNLFACALNKSMSDFFRTYEMKDYVVNSKLPSHFRTTNSLIRSDEVVPMKYYMCRTPGCDSTDVSLVANVECTCKRITNKRMKITDPKGFVSDATFIVTDDLVVTPLRSISTVFHMIANAREGVIEIPVKIGKNEVLALMEGALGSEAVFTDIFQVKEETTADIFSGDGNDSVLV